MFNADPVRVYAGGKVNGVAGAWIGFYPMGTVGVSVRPVDRVVLGVEGSTFGGDGFFLLPSAYAGVRF